MCENSGGRSSEVRCWIRTWLELDMRLTGGRGRLGKGYDLVTQVRLIVLSWRRNYSTILITESQLEAISCNWSQVDRLSL